MTLRHITPKFSPIALFAFNRLEKYVEVLESLKNNSDSKNSDLWVFIDGPKSKKDLIIQNKIYTFTKKLKGFKSLNIIKDEVNKGLAKSITNGVTQLLRKSNSVIVIEDDILVSPYFLEFMNSGLNTYENDRLVASIHGYVYPTTIKLPETFFIRGSDCWGWGTWRRAWVKYNDDGRDLLTKIKNHREKMLFDFDGSSGYIKMLEDNLIGKNDSWAVKWYASTFLENMYTLYPGRSLVTNIGLDGTGTHKGFSRQDITFSHNSRINVSKIKVEDSLIGREAFTKYFETNKQKSLLKLFKYLYRMTQRKVLHG
jgi:hypothetical protein